MRKTLRSLFVWERDFFQHFYRLAIPIVIQSLVMASLHVVDNIMIGQLGEVEMAAVAQANRFTFLFQMTLFGLSGGTAVFVAQYWGKREMDRIHQVLGLALIAAGFFAIAFGVMAIGFPQTVVRILLHEEETIGLSVKYLRIVGIGYFFQAITQVFATILKSTEQPKLPMVASVTAIVTNTILNYGLIFGRLGMPCLGIEGAAIATVIATVVETILVVGLSYAMRLASAAKLRAMIPRGRDFIFKYIRVAGVVVANECLWALGVSLYSVVYGRIGHEAVAAISIFNTVEQMGYAFTRGVTGAASVLIGMHIGRGENEKAYFVSQRMMVASILVALAAGLTLIGSADVITAGFRGVSAAVSANAARIIRVNALFMPLNALTGLLVVGILRAGGDAVASLLFDTGTVWVIGVPMVAIAGLVLGLNIVQVVLVAQVESVVKLILGMWRFRSKRWMNNLTVSPEEGSACNQAEN